MNYVFNIYCVLTSHTGGTDKVVKLWDYSTGKVIQTNPGHSLEITKVFNSVFALILHVALIVHVTYV